MTALLDRLTLPRPLVVTPSAPHSSVEDWKRELGLRDGDVPWWAVGLLDLPPDSMEARARTMFERGCPPAFYYREPHERNSAHNRRVELYWDAWVRVVDMARRIEPFDPQRWLSKAWDQRDDEKQSGGAVTMAVRDACMRSVRAAVEFLDLRDAEDQPLIVKDFHVTTVRALRCYPETVVLLPYEYGKSWWCSIPIPLMDWLEWPDALEGRVYSDDGHADKWIKQLMGVVEYNDRLHRLAPWIRRPVRGDRAFGTWSTEGFAIGGRSDAQKSFEPFTLKRFRVGTRFSRAIGDDWVNSQNAKSIKWQEEFYNFFTQAFLTMGQRIVVRRSKYGTRWGTTGLAGTVYDKNDVNNRARKEIEQRGGKTYRFDVYPRGKLSRRIGETLWPEKHPIEAVKDQERRLGPLAFKLRCRNLVDDTSNDIFPADVYDDQVDQVQWLWNVVPKDSVAVVALDPGKGRKARHSKNPAWMLYAMLKSADGKEWQHHMVAWAALEGVSFTDQCRAVVDVARYHLVKIYVEDNGVQEGYIDYIRTTYPDVYVLPHTTGNNKNDCDSGIEMFKPLMHAGLLIAHTGNAPEHERHGLREEFTKYPNYKYTDRLMAAWIARFQLRGMEMLREQEQVEYEVPDYVDRFSRSQTVTLGRGGW